MQLNQAAAEGGGSAGATSGDLKSNRKTWVKAGEGVTGLKAGVGKALTKLADGQAGLGDTSVGTSTSRKITHFAKDKTPSLNLMVVSGCYQVPDGEKAARF